MVVTNAANSDAEDSSYAQILEITSPESLLDVFTKIRVWHLGSRQKADPEGRRRGIPAS